MERGDMMREGDTTSPTVGRTIDGATSESLTLSVTEAAGLLGISRALAYELIARGDLPSLRLGRRVVVPRHALTALVEDAS
jgi:excisionase family DNA binding protein